MKTKVLLLTCLSLLILTSISCKKNKETVNDNPNPTPQKVFLANEIYRWEDTSDSTNYIIDTVSYIWEGNLLKQTIAKQYCYGMTVTATEMFNYENGLCKEAIGVDHYHYIYNEGRLSECMVVYDYIEDTCHYFFNYDLNGNINKMTVVHPDHTYEYYYTWMNGDVVSVELDGATITFTYDDKPNIYEGFPLYGLNFQTVARLLSKHNLIDPEYYEYTYCGDKMVSKINKTDYEETHYIYTDGTGR